MNRRDFIKSAIIGAAGVSVPLRTVVDYTPVLYVEFEPVIVSGRDLGMFWMSEGPLKMFNPDTSWEV